MYRRIDDFLGAWTRESEATERLLAALSDASLGRAVAPRLRTLARVAWHIVQTIPEMMARTGLVVEGVDEHAPPPAEAAAIRAAYHAAASSLYEKVKASWSDETLVLEDDMYGSKWMRGLTLHSLITHQAHHRGQMTVLMRQAGLKVSGVYGPAMEEWASMGMSPPDV